MGEYALFNGKKIKIGTCENMYYLRYENRHDVIPITGSLDPGKEIDLRFRLPFPDEDNIKPGDYEPFRGERLYTVTENHLGHKTYTPFCPDDLAESPGIIQACHESGLLVNINCYHGIKIPEGNKDFKPCWNGKDPYPIELAFVKATEDGVFPIIKCRHCHNKWQVNWEDILPYIPNQTLQARLEKHMK